MELECITDGVYGVTTVIRPSWGFALPLRSTLLRLQRGGLVVVSPNDVTDEVALQIDALGPVEHIVAPNRLHHLFVKKAALRWPDARVHIAPGLEMKRPGLPFHHTLGDGALPAEIETVLLGGAPALSETVFLHRPSRTLVVTDLVFNVRTPVGFLTPMILWLVGVHRGLAQSRALRFMTTDRVEAEKTARLILAMDFDRLVMAHGEPIGPGAKPQLESALWWMLREERRRLAATNAPQGG